ncbi:hypothetical protein TA3x_002031 [Tundrisphaera sp. TA3]|uniref:hypothetical protein n=1 Tax=Tundrisphaera sp. TA3 TaxID=3435775 RepID=UPI003EB9BC08
MSRPTTPTARRPMAFDFPGVLVGCAEYDDGPTGCTVVRLPARSLVTVDIRGGAPATVMGLDGEVNAICFAGGSLYGLEAVSGVTAAIADGVGEGRPTGLASIPIVRGAAIYDFGARANAIAPDQALGAFALTHAIGGMIPLGPVGAGRSATVGKLGEADPPSEPSIATREGGGQGAAFAMVRVDPDLSIRFLACTVVNAVGGIVDRSGAVVRGHLAADGGRLRASEILRRESGGTPPARGNTTLSLVVIDRWLPDFHARQIAR